MSRHTQVTKTTDATRMGIVQLVRDWLAVSLVTVTLEWWQNRLADGMMVQTVV